MATPESSSSVNGSNNDDTSSSSSSSNNDNNKYHVDNVTTKRKATGGFDNSSNSNSKKSNNNHKKSNNKNDGATAAASCPYLDTVQRSLLDFDFEPSCSVSLEAGPHVYGCLVCGKFFRGRGPRTPAYTHSVDDGHFVFVHLSNGTFHCLPDNYEIHDPSLSDVSAALHPTYSTDEVHAIDSNTGLARDLFGRRYLPGFVGLNNLNRTDYINSTVQALAHVRPIRDYFLRLTHRDVFVPSSSSSSSRSRLRPPHKMSDVAYCFGELVRKMWSDKRFKAHVDPHMLVQAVSRASKKRFRLGRQAEAGEFMAWFLHQLHSGVGGSKKPKSSIISQTFQGRVEVTTRMMTTNTTQHRASLSQEEQQQQQQQQQQPSEEGEGRSEETDETAPTTPGMAASHLDVTEMTAETTFLQLTLDIPEKPLFRDDEGGLVIPQEPLVSVMKKFDGVTFSEAVASATAASSSSNGGGGASSSQRKRYRLLELPPYLILHLARFKTNNYLKEKNPTIVAFPVRNLDLSPYTAAAAAAARVSQPPRPTSEEVRAMGVEELQRLLAKHGHADVAANADTTGRGREELAEVAVDFVCKSLPDLLQDKYDLVANVTHDSPADVGREGKTDPLQEGSYKCHVHHGAGNRWYEIQDLHVQETMPQLIGVSESYLLIFERKSAAVSAPAAQRRTDRST